MTEPPSRQFEAYEANGWPNEVAESAAASSPTGVSGGVEHEKSIISYLNGKVGGIMFWAVNEGARAPNGKTTGENSVALANYAAAL